MAARRPGRPSPQPRPSNRLVCTAYAARTSTGPRPQAEPFKPCSSARAHARIAVAFPGGPTAVGRRHPPRTYGQPRRTAAGLVTECRQCNASTSVASCRVRSAGGRLHLLPDQGADDDGQPGGGVASGDSVRRRRVCEVANAIDESSARRSSRQARRAAPSASVRHDCDATRDFASQPVKQPPHDEIPVTLLIRRKSARGQPQLVEESPISLVGSNQ